MKKIVLLTLALFAPVLCAVAQDLVEHNRAAVQEAENIYNETSARGNAQIQEIQQRVSANEQLLAQKQSELKIAKAKEQHLNRSIQLHKKKLNLQRKMDADQISRDITKNEIAGFKDNLEIAKEVRIRLSKEVDTIKKSIASDKSQIASVKKEISTAKKTLNINQKALKDSEKNQSAASK